MFNEVRDALKQQGIIREIFTFVDSSQLISKLSVWKERDKAIKAGLEKFNNRTAPKVCKDHQARLGCKDKNKFWYEYQRPVSVDMQSGLSNKVAGTPAHTPHGTALKHTCPTQGAVFGDKAYCIKSSRKTLLRKGCHDFSIKMNHMKKNRDKDRRLTACRSPDERVFSKVSKRARYQSIVKNPFQVFMQSLAYNLKRLVSLGIKHIERVPS